MKKRVLIVEEHTHFRKLLSVYLSKNFQVMPAGNGLEAMAWVSKGMVPDAIISGAHSQCESTQDFFNSLGYSGIFAHTPVIQLSAEVVSASVSLSDIQRKLQLLTGNLTKAELPAQVTKPENAIAALN